MIDLFELHAREKIGALDNWHVYRWECFPKTEETIYYEVEGGVAPLKTIGKGKGRPNFRKMDKSTVKRVVITVNDHEEWRKQWLTKTGNCHKCEGEGNLFVRWNHLTGTETKECPICQGTGKSHIP